MADRHGYGADRAGLQLGLALGSGPSGYCHRVPAVPPGVATVPLTAAGGSGGIVPGYRRRGHHRVTYRPAGRVYWILRPGRCLLHCA